MQCSGGEHAAARLLAISVLLCFTTQEEGTSLEYGGLPGVVRAACQWYITAEALIRSVLGFTAQNW
jgi:hypothetical protein